MSTCLIILAAIHSAPFNLQTEMTYYVPLLLLLRLAEFTTWWRLALAPPTMLATSHATGLAKLNFVVVVVLDFVYENEFNVAKWSKASKWPPISLMETVC